MAATPSETSAQAKVTEYTLEELVQPPSFWTVEVDGRELSVHTAYSEGDLRITSVSERLRKPPFSQDIKLTHELRDAVHAAVLAEIESLNLELVGAVARALIRETLDWRRVGAHGILDRFREVPRDELVARLQARA